MKQGAEFIDARAWHASDPETFDLPSDARIQQIEPGTFVKIGVRFPSNTEDFNGERFWVQVTRRDGDRLVGRIDNDLFHTDSHGLRLDDEIAFHVQHILDTDTFDYLTSVSYVEADENEPAEFVVGIVGKYTRIWLRVGDQEMGTALGPGHHELDTIIGALIEARGHLIGDARGRPDA